MAINGDVGSVATLWRFPVNPAVGYNSAFSSEGSGFFAPSSWRPSGRHYVRRNRTSSHATAPSM